MSSTYADQIIHLSRAEIDTEKWDSCVDQYGLPYGYSWYLDISCQGQWNALVLGDYNLVMPLPFNRKLFGLYQVYQPILSQQLGVFGGLSRSYKDFLSAIPEYYRKVTLPLSDDRYLAKTTFKKRVNLILPVSEDLARLRKGYQKSLRKRIRRAATTQTVSMVNSDGLAELISTYRRSMESKLAWSNEQYELVKALLQMALRKSKGVIAKVEQNGQTTAIGFFLLGNNRLINLFGASTSIGRETFAMHLLLDQMIAYAHESGLHYFDFEGSEIPGVANFFRSYGSQEEHYYQYERNSLPAFINWALSQRRSSLAMLLTGG